VAHAHVDQLVRVRVRVEVRVGVGDRARGGAWVRGRVSMTWRKVFQKAWVSEIEARYVGSHPTKASTTLRWSRSEWSR